MNECICQPLGGLRVASIFISSYPLKEKRTKTEDINVLKSCYSFQGGKESNHFRFFHWFASWNEILVTVFPVRCVCTTIQTYSRLFTRYWILTNLNDVSSASTCAKYTYFSFLEFLLGYELLFSLNLQTAQRTQVHVKSWYVFTEAKRLSEEKKKKGN